MTPLARGTLLAIAAAISFGATTPVVAWAAQDTSPFTIAALLYAGAAIAAGVAGLVRGGMRLERSDAPRVLLVTLAGAVAAPVLLAYGLTYASATSGALLLNLEAVFTVVLAWLVFREHIGRRVAAAVAVTTMGGVVLVVGPDVGGGIGLVAVAGATLCWAIDNTLIRPLGERDPLAVVTAKGALGAALTGGIALAFETAPSMSHVAALLVCGATGYGLSLRLYLEAQRLVGAARTGSVFAVAPFVGAAIALATGERALDMSIAAATALFATGVYLHVTERHGHAHTHESLSHSHAHRHDDDHHGHTHDPPVIGEHVHEHRHDALVHSHEHGIDLHHDHTH